MNKLLVEIKARCADHEPIRAGLNALNARCVGLDHQVDTYFKVPENRLKLREGTIEKNLIYYHRPNQTGPKRSDVILHKPVETDSLKAILERVHGILVVVDKHREIWFVDNVKIHLDEVDELGRFVEIEAIGAPGTHTDDQLRDQCEALMRRFQIREDDLLTSSYSDMLLEKNA
ncbi:class IV adenylate cyclase [bacterium]|nr:class IV adenylate cyclase [bacterium]